MGSSISDFFEKINSCKPLILLNLSKNWNDRIGRYLQSIKSRRFLQRKLSMSKKTKEKLYEALSPFELKNQLFKIAKNTNSRKILNAGRGNPNWISMVPRQAFFTLGEFAITQANHTAINPALGKFVTDNKIGERFDQFLQKHSQKKDIIFLKLAISYVTNVLKINKNDFLTEMVDGILGCHYPTPTRMLSISEKIVHKYLQKEMAGDDKSFGKMNLFATEGGTAAMDYVFTGLMENHLLHKGDKIAIGTPIFTPYIEIPKLNDFEFVEICVEQVEKTNWFYSKNELKKLEDPSVKAFFLVNPSNPTAVNLHEESIETIRQIIEKKNPNLIIITDDVYGTFVNGFRSLISKISKNTILVYSYSKYFGATGWRLGVIGIHNNNIFDQNIAKLPNDVKRQLNKRYETVVSNPNTMKFIDRLSADSRLVALHHTSGLSTPQQIMMVLFSLYCLIDDKEQYKKSVQNILKKRFDNLYEALDIKQEESIYDTHYYTIIDIPSIAEKRYGTQFKKYLITQFEPIDFVWQLAKEKGVILLDGNGFKAPRMSVRVSLANLMPEDYKKIGFSINELLKSYYDAWKAKK